MPGVPNRRSRGGSTAAAALCALYLTSGRKGRAGAIPSPAFIWEMARDWSGSTGWATREKRGLRESYGIMVNYLYDLATIEANHEAFVREGIVTCSRPVTALLAPDPPAALRRARAK